MKLVLTILFFFAPLNVNADEPPDWQTHFKQLSDNKNYVVEISPVEPIKTNEPWNMQYILEVRKNAQNEQSILWSSTYFHSGYSQVMVSNDGSYVAYIEYWYFSDSELVRIYSEKSIREWSADDLAISRYWLPKTVSHRLWLKGTPSFIENPDGLTVGIELPTYKGKRVINF